MATKIKIYSYYGMQLPTEYESWFYETELNESYFKTAFSNSQVNMIRSLTPYVEMLSALWNGALSRAIPESSSDGKYK